MGVIRSTVWVVREEKVMIDRDLAELYGVETKQLKRAVRRNLQRFPSDFMFELSREEYNSLRSQFGALKRGTHSKYLPMAFTEQGVAMLSSVLNSDRAIDVNIAIMRAFVQLRKISSSHKQLAQKLREIEIRLEDHDGEYRCNIRGDPAAYEAAPKAQEKDLLRSICIAAVSDDAFSGWSCNIGTVTCY